MVKKQNQEDSLIINRTSAERGNYKGIAFNNIKAELDKGEKFGNPDESNTIIDKKHSDYSKLQGGFLRKGTMVVKDDAVIGKLFQLPKPADHRIYKDTSIIYPYAETAMVDTVIRARNQDDEEFCKVKFSSVRTLGIGDKFCLKPTAQILTTQGWIELQNITLQHKVACLVNNKYLEYHNPTEVYRFQHEGLMYKLESQQVQITCTPNHKLYVKKRDYETYGLYPASEIKGKRVNFKKDAENNNMDIPEYICLSERENLPDLTFNMDDYLQLLAIFIGDGWTDKYKNGYIVISATKERKVEKIKNVCQRMNLPVKHQFYERNVGGTDGKHYIYCPQLYDQWKSLSVGALNKFLPEITWMISQRQARLFLEAMIDVDGSYKNTGSAAYFTSSKKLADDVSRLCLHAGWSGNVKVMSYAGIQSTTSDGRIITSNADRLSVNIVKTKNNPQINHGHIKTQTGQHENWVDYNGEVMCVEVPEHVFYFRENDYAPPSWTGNSSRAG